jgi:BspA type Leucine rich repeat region (6 copies)
MPQRAFTIPYSVTNIGDGAFAGGSTYSINVDTNNLYYSSKNGVLFDITKTILIQYPCGRTDGNSYGAPDYYGLYITPESVSSINSHAFYGCQYLTNISLPLGCQNIGNYSFCGCSKLTIITNRQNSFTVSANVTNIGTGAFANCTSLNAITADSQNTNYCDLSGVLFSKDQTAIVQYPAGIVGAYEITNSVVSIAQSAFSGCGGLNAITIPESVKNIGNVAFNSCSGLINVTIPNSVTNIGSSAFAWCSRLSSFTFGTNLSFISTNQFYQCTSLKSVLIPNNIKNIENDAFDSSGLTAVTVPESVTNIEDYAFYGTSLTNAIIYKGVTHIGALAFSCVNSPIYNSSNLISIFFEGDAPDADQLALNQDNKATVYYMPNTSGWGTNYCSRPTKLSVDCFTNNNAINISSYIGPFSDLTIPNEIYGLPVTSIANYAFANTVLQDVAIPTSITNIGSSAFSGCVGITNLNIPDTVLFIGDSAFASCSNLVSITLSDSISTIGNGLFYKCSSLNKIQIPSGVTSIGSQSFLGCQSLTNVFIPCGVTNIGYNAFSGCSHLQGLYFCGNPPNATFFSFFSVFPKIYYLPSALGWTNSYQGLTTVLWNPQPQISDGIFGVQSNQFSFNINGNTNIVVSVNACTNLASPVWTPIQTLTLTNGTAYFSDPQWTNSPSRFYGFGFPQ